MFDAICSVFLSLSDPAEAASILSKPGYFATTDNGLAMANSSECRIVLCDEGQKKYAEYVYKGSSCPISLGAKYLTRDETHEVFAFSLSPNPAPGLFGSIASQITYLDMGGNSIVLQSPKITTSTLGLEATEYKIAGDLGAAEVGSGYLFGEASGSKKGHDDLLQGLNAIVEAGVDLATLSGFVLHHSVLAADFDGKYFLVRLPAGPTGIASSSVEEVALNSVRTSSANIRALGQVTCSAGKTDPIFQRITIDIFRYDTNLERLNEQCE